jgi:hypothetical protein
MPSRAKQVLQDGSGPLGKTVRLPYKKAKDGNGWLTQHETRTERWGHYVHSPLDETIVVSEAGFRNALEEMLVKG